MLHPRLLLSSARSIHMILMGGGFNNFNFYHQSFWKNHTYLLTTCACRLTQFNDGYQIHRTTMAIAGDDYAIVGGCTRMSTGYEILSRTQSKLFDLWVTETDFVNIIWIAAYSTQTKNDNISMPSLYCRTDQTVLTTAGCMTDVITLRRMIAAKLTQYVFRICCLTYLVSSP